MADNLSLPAEPQQVKGLPENYHNLVFEQFETLNTKPLRPGIKDAEMAWCDGWMPLGPNNLRVLWGTGNAIFYAGALTVEWFAFGNIGETPYLVVLLSDGRITAINTQSLGATTVMPPGTIKNPSSIMGFSQWGSLYLIFAKDQENGYWLWDGSNLFTAGTFGPVVSIDNAGKNYTSPPSFTIQNETGIIANGAFSGTIENGSLTRVTVTNPGSGFTVNSLVAVTVQGGGSDDQAIAAVSVTTTSGGVSEVVIRNGGSGYTAAATGVFVGGGGSGAVASLAIQNGVIVGVSIVNSGLGYTSPPTFVVNPIGGGSGFSGFVNIAFGQITGVGVVYGGTGYTTPPTLKIIGDGTGASGIVQIQSGQVVGVIMNSLGSGYTKAIAVFEGGNNAANVTARLMPFGVSGTSVEVFQGSVWVTNGAALSDTPPRNRTIFSAPSSPVDFGDGGGAFASFDSFLRIGYQCLKQSNGFLYLIGDSSINYISGVQTTTPSSSSVSAQPITTFGNQNVDPQLGTPWPSSVQVFSRNIVFANSIGIFVSYGGAVTKVSLPLDGFYGSGPITGAGSNFSSAVANIFGIPVYMLLLPVVDPFTGRQVNKLLMWDGKRFFTSQQDKNLTYIATQEINSVLTAWGTDGTSIFPLFSSPSTGFTKVVQSKLYSSPGYFVTKTGLRLHGVVNSYALNQPITITIDNENGLGTGNALQVITPVSNGLTWKNNLGQTINWNLSWGVPGLDVFGPYPVAQQGRMIGITVQTSASDLALLSINVTQQNYTINV